MEELRALYRGEVASKKEYDDDPSLGRYGEWCKQQKVELTIEELEPQTLSLWQLYLLWRARFPFRANDLSVDDWRTLGWMDLMFSRIDQERLVRMALGNGET